MRHFHSRNLAIGLLACLCGLPVRGADSKAPADPKAPVVRQGKLKEGGTYMDVPGAKLTDEVWKQIESTADLKSFSGSGKEFDDAALARLSKITTIETLFFNGPGITDNGLPTLAHFHKLHKYGTDHGQYLTGSGLSALVGARNIQVISFGGCMFNDQGMEALGLITQLREVYLNHDRLTSAGFPNFAKLTELQKLRFNPAFSPYYTGADLVALAGLKNLQELTIGQMIIPYDDGLAHLKTLRQLKKLKLDNCGVTETDLVKLKADLPETTVEFTAAPPEAVKKWNDAVAKKLAAKSPK